MQNFTKIGQQSSEIPGKNCRCDAPVWGPCQLNIQIQKVQIQIEAIY